MYSYRIGRGILPLCETFRSTSDWMTASARLGSTSLSTRMASRARTASTASGVCAAYTATFQLTVVGPAMAPIPC